LIRFSKASLARAHSVATIETQEIERFKCIIDGMVMKKQHYVGPAQQCSYLYSRTSLRHTLNSAAWNMDVIFNSISSCDLIMTQYS